MVEDPDGSAPGAPVTTPYVTNSVNQYTTVDALAAPAYDANGNLTQFQPRTGDPVWTYTYDAQNRLTSGSSTNGDSFAFAYDARNRCVSRTINGTTTRNYFDDWSAIEERTPADTVQARYIHGAMLDEILLRTTPAGNTYYHHDQIGSTTVLSDATGALVEQTTYDAYGAPTFRDATGTPVAASPTSNAYLFTGREWLHTLRLNDHRNRYYQPDVGRWLSRDPIEEEGGGSICTGMCGMIPLF